MKRNILQCYFCGFAVYSGSNTRNCSRCDHPMKHIGLEEGGKEEYFSPKKK